MMSKLRWFDAEQKRPSSGTKIIFVDAIGLFYGTFHAIGDGVVYVCDKKTDAIEWENIYQWIEYPDEEK